MDGSAISAMLVLGLLDDSDTKDKSSSKHEDTIDGQSSNAHCYGAQGFVEPRGPNSFALGYQSAVVSLGAQGFPSSFALGYQSAVVSLGAQGFPSQSCPAHYEGVRGPFDITKAVHDGFPETPIPSDTDGSHMLSDDSFITDNPEQIIRLG
jgi:hypothetical protein